MKEFKRLILKIIEDVRVLAGLLIFIGGYGFVVLMLIWTLAFEPGTIPAEHPLVMAVFGVYIASFVLLGLLFLSRLIYFRLLRGRGG